jgi:hypothetical protein
MTLQPVDPHLDTKVDVLHICEGFGLTHAIVARNYAKEVGILLDK